MSNSKQSVIHALSPPLDEDDNPLMTDEEYWDTLSQVNRKEPLREACEALNITVIKSASLDRLRTALQNHWYPREIRLPQSLRSEDEEIDLVAEFTGRGGDNSTAEEALAAEEVLAIDDEEGETDVEPTEGDEDTAVEEEVEEGDSSGTDSEGDEYETFKQRIRVEENQRSENNRRAGGIKTQKAMVKAWKEFRDLALEKGEIKDDIIDEIHLLLYIRFCAERPKRTRKGVDREGTFIGASHIKKLYFGALRIRKGQDADDPSLRIHRPATSVHVWDALKSRMTEALERTRNGIMPGEDAPDIIANTFLDSITEAQMEKIGRGFLAHRELRSVINGHLAWTGQNATGNRGDDFRALKLSELQPYSMAHPNKVTKIQTVLGLQGEEKAGTHRGMRTKINPAYSTFIAHMDPKMCPLGAISFYLHYIFDIVNIERKMEINWTWNASWRQIRVLHGQKSPTTPYNDQNLYNLYVRAFKHAAFESQAKVHFPRRRVGYKQEELGVDPRQTSKLGWKRGDTFENSYAPKFPKDAILGCGGYKVSEEYDPLWRHVKVPEQFLQLVCPMAEDIRERIILARQHRLHGAEKFWDMVILLRPYLFQCGAAIFEAFPESNLFKLPALANRDVRNWMKTEYRTSMTVLWAKAGNPIDFERIENELIRQALESLRSVVSSNHMTLQEMDRKIERRTAVLSPTKMYSTTTYSNRFTSSSSTDAQLPPPTFVLPTTPERKITTHGAVYELDALDASESSPSRLRAFANESPRTPSSSPRIMTQVDLVLPPVAAFSKLNEPQLIWPPVLGQKSITWEQIFPLIKRPEFLWESWGPSKTLENLTLEEVWTWYSSGEQVFNSENIQTGIKPPLHSVEMNFQGRWRKKPVERKAWQRFREIPEYIDSECAKRSIPPRQILSELESLRTADNGKLKGLSALSRHLESERKRLFLELKAHNKADTHANSSATDNADAEDEGSAPAKKRKAAPVAPRKRTKKVKSD